MNRYNVEITHCNGEWHSFTVLARNEQFAIWNAFDELRAHLRANSMGGWVARNVTFLQHWR